MAVPEAPCEPAAQDPDEPFDLYTEDGRALGRAKPRAEVHRDGDWHRSLHIWVIVASPSLGEEKAVLFQRRSLAKDTWPGAIDVAVTGHLRAGEGVTEALREAREEIGIALGPGEVTRLGLRRRVDDHAPGLLDRELQDIYVTRVTRVMRGAPAAIPLEALVPDPAEVTGLLALPIAEALALFRGEIDAASGLAIDAHSRGEGRITAAPPVRLAEFVDARDGYYLRALRSIVALLDGAPEPTWEMG
jgi:isopentenyldiphosphate isomerase